MINYNKEIDRENIEIFKRYELRNPQARRHKCVICEARTSINESCSIEGHKLVCRKCLFEKFNDEFKKLREWQEEDD